ncbi:MAG TPA: helix-turn-helix domain-containing protein [Candidatus Binatus sp.]|nr:helix-turn-helix domain-containing protein [Candidatus Binatus sp.]
MSQWIRIFLHRRVTAHFSPEPSPNILPALAGTWLILPYPIFSHIGVEELFEMSLRLKPSHGYYDIHNQLSDKFPGTRISLWCNDQTDILEIEADGLESFELLQKELTLISKERNSKIVSKTYLQDKFQLVARQCCCGGDGTIPIGPIIQGHNFMEVPPIIFFDGWEYHRLVGFDDADVRGLLKGLDKVGKTEILHKKEITEGGVTDDTFLVSFNNLFGQLTRKQTMAMVSAIEHGYYEIPRHVTADDLAKKNGQPRSTFEEHIRKAERKVVLAMAPYMMMYARIPPSSLVGARTKDAGTPLGGRLLRQLIPVSRKK